MPIYEYRCRQCGHETEALQKISAAPLVDCPACGDAALVKLVSAAGFQLKGTGWYATDFRASGAAKPDANAGKPADGDSASKGTATEGSSPGDAPACGAGACPACQ